jgi:hypothetical protein
MLKSGCVCASRFQVARSAIHLAGYSIKQIGCHTQFALSGSWQVARTCQVMSGLASCFVLHMCSCCNLRQNISSLLQHDACSQAEELPGERAERQLSMTWPDIVTIGHGVPSLASTNTSYRHMVPNKYSVRQSRQALKQ